MKTAKRPARITYSEASASMSSEWERVVSDAIATMRRQCVFTPIVFYGHPLPVGPTEPAHIKLGWRRPNEPMPAGCSDICTLPAHAYPSLHVVRALADAMANFPAFNSAAIA